MPKVLTNEQFVKQLMNHNPAGALCQAFIIEAIARYAQVCAQGDPARFNSGLLNGAAWQTCAQHIHAECEKVYGPRRPLEGN